MKAAVRPRSTTTVAVAILVLSPSLVRSQAFTPPERIGAVTLAWQVIDNTGHRLSDGFYRPGGESVSTSALLELEYGLTDRLTVTGGIPYVFAKYTGAQPPFSGLPVDTCACWHSSFQDYSVAARYRFGDNTWAVTPLVRFLLPSHGYPYEGEAVVGRNLNERQVGVSAGLRVPQLSKATLQTTYIYSFVERPLEDVNIDRSQGVIQVGYAITSKLYASGTGNWQHTHGGLRAGSPTGDPFPFPGELNTPERYSQRDRVLRTHYWQFGGGVSYTAGPVDLFFSFSKYVWGRDAHNGQAYTFGSTWYFDLSR